MMDKSKLVALKECHRQLAKVLGPDAEPIEVLVRVEEHRAYWQPDRARVILLAESHVYTTCSELAHRVVRSDLVESGVPQQFVRLVYCLGYGENEILDQPINAPKNSGTPLYWKLFYSCVHEVDSNEDFAPILVTRTTFPERIRNKLALLNCLQDAGVWLVDTSVAALYLPGGGKPKELAKCLQTSWDAYVGQVVTTARPSHIVCIGKGVANSLGNRLSGLGIPVTVVPEPSARLTAKERFETYRTCYQVACKVPEKRR